MRRSIVAVLSANYRKAYPVIKSLARHGYTILAVFHDWRSYALSRYIKLRLRTRVSTVTDYDKLLRALQRLSISHVFPISYTDYENIGKLVPEINIKIPFRGKADELADKYLLQEVCRQLGLKYPRTLLVVPQDADLETLADKIVRDAGLPLVIKGRSDASRPVYVTTRDELVQELRRRIGREVLVQELILGTGCGYFAIAVEGEPIIEYTHVRIIEEKASGGPSMRACLSFDPRIIRIGRQILRHFRWTGPIMVEMKQHVETGELYIIEINPKLWGSLELAVSHGIDLPCELLRLEGEPIACRHSVRVHNRCFTWLVGALHYLRDNPTVWFKMLRQVIREGVLGVSDIHIDDPPELVYGVLTRLLTVLRGFSRSDWKTRFLHNFKKIARIVLNLRLVVFDLDGTLVNLNVNWRKLRSELVRKGLVRKYESIMMAVLRSQKMGDYERINDEISRWEIEAAKNIKINHKLRTELEKLSKKVIVAVATKQCRKAAAIALSRLGIGDLFSIVVTREISVLKEEQIRYILNKLSVRPNQTLIIGDSLADMNAACRCGTWFIAVAKNMYMAQMYAEYGVPCFFSILDVLKILNTLLDRIQGRVCT